MPGTAAIVHQMMTDKLGLVESDFSDKSSFKKDLHVDSLDLYELLMEVEKECGILISDEVAEKLTTVGALIKYATDLM